MQTRSSDENSVCLSVRLSVCLLRAWIVTKRWKYLSRFLYLRRRIVGRVRPLLPESLGQPASVKAKSSIVVRSASAVTSNEKSSINANRKSTTRFPMSLRWSSYVAPKSPKGGLKNAKRPISIKNALRLKKVCYKVSLCENCQRQSCKAFIGLTIGAKIIGGGRPLLPQILDQSDRVWATSLIFAVFSLVAPPP